MTAVGFFSFFSSVICLLCAVYVAVGRNLFRVAIALFCELCALASVFICLNAEYLASITFGAAVLVAVAFVAFGSFIKGNLHSPLPTTPKDGASILRSVIGAAVGIGLGGLIGAIFLTRGIGTSLDTTANSAIEVSALGDALFLEHRVLFVFIGLFALILIIGSGLLLRRPDDAE